MAQIKYSYNISESEEVNFLWCETCRHIGISKTRKAEFDQHYDNKQTASCRKITSINYGELLGVWGKKSASLDGDCAATRFSSIYKKLFQFLMPILSWSERPSEVEIFCLF